MNPLHPGLICPLASHVGPRVLQLLCAVMGVGMSSVYATSLLWSERYIEVTNRVGALFTLFGMALANALQA